MIIVTDIEEVSKLKKNSSEAIPLIIQFCRWLEEQKKSPSTVKTYGREMEKYHEWLQKKGTGLDQLQKSDIQSYIYFLEDQQKSTTTIDKTVGVIRTFAKFLEKPELTFGLDVKPVEKKYEIETLSPTEYRQLFQSVKADGDLRNITIVYVLLHAGLRISELCNLNRSDIDFEKKELWVRRYDEERVIPLSEEAEEYLEAYLATHDHEAVFVSHAGDRLSERAVQYMLKKYNVHPQKLRHTFCQRLVDNHVDLETVSRLAGHRDINVTKRYVRSQNVKQKIEEAINKTFKMSN